MRFSEDHPGAEDAWVDKLRKDVAEDEYPTTIRHKSQLQYCPLCGRRTATETFKVGTFKTNQRVKCPKHGELLLG